MQDFVEEVATSEQLVAADLAIEPLLNRGEKPDLDDEVRFYFLRRAVTTIQARMVQGQDIQLAMSNLVLYARNRSDEERDLVERCLSAAIAAEHLLDRPTVRDFIFHQRRARTEGQSFEDRLAALADSLEMPEVKDITPDRILMGVLPEEELGFDQTVVVVTDCLNELKRVLDQYGGKANVVFNEKQENYFRFLATLPIELMVMGAKSMLTFYRLPLNTQSKAWIEIAAKIKPFIG